MRAMPAIAEARPVRVHLMPTRHGVAFPAQILRQVSLHLGGGLVRHGVQMGVDDFGRGASRQQARGNVQRSTLNAQLPTINRPLQGGVGLHPEDHGGDGRRHRADVHRRGVPGLIRRLPGRGRRRLTAPVHAHCPPVERAYPVGTRLDGDNRHCLEQAAGQDRQRLRETGRADRGFRAAQGPVPPSTAGAGAVRRWPGHGAGPCWALASGGWATCRITVAT